MYMYMICDNFVIRMHYLKLKSKFHISWQSFVVLSCYFYWISRGLSIQEFFHFSPPTWTYHPHPKGWKNEWNFNRKTFSSIKFTLVRAMVDPVPTPHIVHIIQVRLTAIQASGSFLIIGHSMWTTHNGTQEQEHCYSARISDWISRRWLLLSIRCRPVWQHRWSSVELWMVNQINHNCKFLDRPSVRLSDGGSASCDDATCIWIPSRQKVRFGGCITLGCWFVMKFTGEL